MTEQKLDAEFWNRRASKTREEASYHAAGKPKHEMLLRVAKEYEKLARRQQSAVEPGELEQQRSMS